MKTFIYQNTTLSVINAVLVKKDNFPDILYLYIKGKSPIIDVPCNPVFKMVLTANTGERWIYENIPSLKFSILVNPNEQE